jgi:N-acetylglucosaminyl-diphospho-decaprenol L-rhamnosyltransferase
MNTPSASAGRTPGSRGTGVRVSFVIAARNNWHYLDPCIASIPRAGLDDCEVIVVDNASTDGTVGLLQERCPRVRLLQNSTNMGHCRAINQGIGQAQGEYIVVLDGDTVLWPEAVSRLVEFLDSRPDVAIAAPRTLNTDGSVQETARSFPRVLNGLFGRHSILTRLFPDNPFSRRYLRRDGLHNSAPFEVDWVSAACMIFRRSLPGRIGRWDENFNGYWVDADWCKAAHATGKVYCVPAARVTHFEQNRPGRKKGARRIVLFHVGAFRFYYKNRTFGSCDPRALLAAVALATRCMVLVVLDWCRPPGRYRDADARVASGLSGACVLPDSALHGSMEGQER